jgi:hypothetical protein
MRAKVARGRNHFWLWHLLPEFHSFQVCDHTQAVRVALTAAPCSECCFLLEFSRELESSAEFPFLTDAFFVF